jgi:hypothetical protein
MKKAQVEQLERVIGQITALHREINVAGKKSTTDAVNAFKLKFINTILSDANNLLGSHRPLADFEQFADESLPSNSDVTFILAQYAESLDLLRSRNIAKDWRGWHYIVEDSSEIIFTSPPGALKRGG